MNKIFALVLAILIMITTIPINVLSAGPTDHSYIATQTIPKLPNSYIKDIIVNNRQCFDSCYVATEFIA